MLKKITLVTAFVVSALVSTTGSAFARSPIEVPVAKPPQGLCLPCGICV